MWCLQNPMLLLVISFTSITVFGLPTKIHPPVWEYTYTFELFEKIYEQMEYLKGAIQRATNNRGRCPSHWKEGEDRNCYFLPLYQKLNWYKSQEFCERIGGQLTIIESEQENEFINNYLVDMQTNKTSFDLKYIWIGGFDFHKEGEWTWVNGKLIDYANWRVPIERVSKALGAEEDCIDWSNGWNDNNCANRYHFLCEKEKH